MAIRDGSARILIYSHDTFGLGHLRRCRAIAHALVDSYKSLTALILSGSPIIGSFDFRARVDFVRIPGVIKLRNGAYTSLGLHLDIEDTLALRASIIRHAAAAYAPDVFIVDKEPLGLRGEAAETLGLLKARGTRLILGLRDVLDEPAVLRAEWARKKVLPALVELYDEIWVYGLPEVYDPLAGIDLPEAARRKVVFTGYLPREAPAHLPAGAGAPPIEPPYLLVTTGGGGDGENLADWVLSAYECAEAPPWNALLVLGPFMPPDRQESFRARAARIARVEVVVFDAHLETLMAGAAGVVAMGGYNTFCEILSFDKPALIVPRRTPRLEQYIRAARARDLGLAAMLVDDAPRDPALMARMLAALPDRPPPSTAAIPGLLDGFARIAELIGRSIGRASEQTRIGGAG